MLENCSFLLIQRRAEESTSWACRWRKKMENLLKCFICSAEGWPTKSLENVRLSWHKLTFQLKRSNILKTATQLKHKLNFSFRVHPSVAIQSSLSVRMNLSNEKIVSSFANSHIFHLHLSLSLSFHHSSEVLWYVETSVSMQQHIFSHSREREKAFHFMFRNKLRCASGHHHGTDSEFSRRL